MDIQVQYDVVYLEFGVALAWNMLCMLQYHWKIA